MPGRRFAAAVLLPLAMLVVSAGAGTVRGDVAQAAADATAPAVPAAVAGADAAGAAVADSGATTSRVPPPRDVDFPGTIELEVDASDVEHRVYSVRERLPVAAPGPLTLLYPRWLPGNHGPTGPSQSLAGLVVQVAGDPSRRLPWRRDDYNMYAFHLEVPAGVEALELRFEFIGPAPGDATARRLITPDMLGLQWEKTLLYPAGHYSSRVRFRPAVRLPAGWGFATALAGAERDGDRVRFAALTLEHLVDSPLFAGRHVRRFELDTDPRGPVSLNVFADRAGQLDATPAQVEAHRKLVAEARQLFGARHYRRYEFLLALSENFSGIGLEHHQSSENGTVPGYFIDWEATAPVRDLLPHEFVHSWNGKYRRPADLWTPSYDAPMRNSLLWVYEGQTEFWDVVLAARSGLWSEALARDALAQYAAAHGPGRPGRQWRNLQDTTNQSIMAYRLPLPYPSWQRSTDYYTEGVLLWLEVDARLGELTRGRRSLDDFARAFFGTGDGELGPSLYRFDDVVATLAALAPFDWRGLLRERLDGHDPSAPLAALERAGWRVAWRDKPSTYTRLVDAGAKRVSATFSLGLSVAREGGRIVDVVWGGPAYQAGVAPGAQLVAVNGRAWSGDELLEALRQAQQDGQPVELLLRRDDRYLTVKVPWREGPRYPQLERIDGRPDRLGPLLRPRT